MNKKELFNAGASIESSLPRWPRLPLTAEMGVDVFIPSAHSKPGQNIDPSVGFDKPITVRDSAQFFCGFFFEIIGAHIPSRVRNLILVELGLRLGKLLGS